MITPRFEEAVARLRRAQEQGQIPPDADLPRAVEMLYGPMYYRHVLRRPIQSEGEIAGLVTHVLRAIGVPPEP